MAAEKAKADKNSQGGFLRNLRKLKNPKVKKKFSRPTSMDIREKCKCQGEMASKAALIRGSHLFWGKTSLARKYINSIVAVAKRAAGKRMAKVFNPKTAIEGMVR